MTTAKMRAYWVTYTGFLSDSTGQFDRENPSLKPFLGNLTRELLAHRHTECPAVLTYGDGKVVLTSVLRAPSEGSAIDFAKAAFTEAFANAGGSSNFPDGSHPSWQLARLLQYGTVQELDTAAQELEAAAEVA